MRRALLIAAMAALALGAGCTGNLPVPQIVLTPRVLIIVADQPEAHPGDDVELRVLAYDPMGRPLTYRWRACLSLGAILSQNDVDTGLPDEACFDLASTGDTAIVPGEQTQQIVDGIAGAPLPDETRAFVNALLSLTGLGFEVQVDVLGPGDVVLTTAYKTVGITTRDTLTTNPPPIDYRFGDTYVSMPREGFTGSGFDCVIWGQPIVLPPETQIEIVPQGDEEPAWLESYPVLGYDGRFTMGMEGAYYSFHATGGTLEAETTNPPLQNLYYTTPEEPGPVRFWLEVRDGHLGARACTFELTVAPAG